MIVFVVELELNHLVVNHVIHKIVQSLDCADLELLYLLGMLQVMDLVLNVQLVLRRCQLSLQYDRRLLGLVVDYSVVYQVLAVQQQDHQNHFVEQHKNPMFIVQLALGLTVFVVQEMLVHYYQVSLV